MKCSIKRERKCHAIIALCLLCAFQFPFFSFPQNIEFNLFLHTHTLAEKWDAKVDTLGSETKFWWIEGEERPEKSATTYA